MQLDPRLTLREERDQWLLYDARSGGLIGISKEAWQTLIVQDNKEAPYYEELRTTLFESAFLVEKPGDAKNAEEDPLKSDMESEDSMLELRSQANPITVLWAITSRCNLRCLYCFPDCKSQGAVASSPSVASLMGIADQLIAAQVFVVTLSGGECLLVRDVWRVIDKLTGARIKVAVLSNGTTISDHVVERCKTHGVHVGISLDAPNEEINQITRGRRAFKSTVRGIERMTEAGVPINVLVTLTKYNFPILHQHIDFLSSLGVRFVGLQDLRPFGDLEIYDQTRLTTSQERALRSTYLELKERFPHIRFNPTELFLFSKSDASTNVMQCPAGDNFAYIDAYGDLYPCTSLPTYRMGSLLVEGASLTALWRDSESVNALRRLKAMPLDSLPHCRACPNRARCEGGCRGDALFYSGDALGLPSRCPKRLGFLEDS